MENQILEFFCTHKAGKQTISKLKNAVVGAWFDEKKYSCYTFNKGNAEITPDSKPDFVLYFSPETIDRILNPDFEDVGDFGVEFFKCLASSDDKVRVKAKINTGLLTLTRRGYLSLIPMGGPKVLKFLSSIGVLGPAGIKKAIDMLRK